MKEIRISIYLKNITDSPSAYYSITQYVSRMDDFHGHVYGLWPDRLFRIFMKPVFRKGIGSFFRKGVLFLIQSFNMWRFMIRDVYFYKPQIIVICREMFPQMMLACFQRLYCKLLRDRKVIWTFDDNIVMGEISKREWGLLCKYADDILVTHDYLKDTLPKRIRWKAAYIPQADGDIASYPLDRAKARREMLYRKEIHLVWVATSANLPYMNYISNSLEKAAKLLQMKEKKALILNVVCNMPYNKRHRYLQVNNIPWTRDEAVKTIVESHIGIMPLIDSEYTRGKGGFKLVQYMTADLPVLCSNVGYNGTVVGEHAGILIDDKKNPDAWVDAILALSTDEQKWLDMGRAAHIQCNERFSFAKNLQYWKNKFGML